MNSTEINFTPESFKRLKKTYEEHKGKGRDYVFAFEGHELIIGYAKYLIEYLEPKLGE